MKKLIVAFSLVLASGFVANNVYAAANPTVKSEIKKEKEKKKKKSKKGCATETKSCSSSSAAGATTKSCCAGKK